MRFVRAENKRIARYNFGLAVLVANDAFAGNHQIQFPLGRMRVVREIAFFWWNSRPFQVERMTLGQIERSRFTSQRFGNSFERSCVFSAWRLPRVFLDFVDVYLSHFFVIPSEVEESLDYFARDNASRDVSTP